MLVLGSCLEVSLGPLFLLLVGALSADSVVLDTNIVFGPGQPPHPEGRGGFDASGVLPSLPYFTARFLLALFCWAHNYSKFLGSNFFCVIVGHYIFLSIVVRVGQINFFVVQK